MRQLSLAFLCLLVAFAQTAHAQKPAELSSDDYKLVWSDEFDTDGPPDPKNWTYERGFVRNQEAQWYQPDNARCKKGMLIIEARNEKLKNPNYDPAGFRWQSSREFADYTSASLTTHRLHEFTYGRFEMKAKIDTRDGIWPAFWTVGASRRWPAGGEIDIMEYYRGMLKANVAWAGQSRRNGATWRSTVKQLVEFPSDWPNKFHIWRMDWDENAIKLFVDDQLLNETSLKETVNSDSQQTNPFHSPQYIILNVAIGGTEGGDPSKTEFPSRMEVDYVRVHQKPNPSAAANNSISP